MNPAVPSKRSSGSKSSASKSSATVSWREVEPAPVVLLAGPEDYLASRARDRLRGLLREKQPDTELVHFDASTYASGELTLQSSPSLFGEAKLIEAVNLASMNEDFLTETLAYLKDPSPDAVLVLHHAGGNRGKKLLDAVKAAGAPVVECQPFKKDAEKLDFVTSEFRTARRRIDPGAARALVNAVGSSLSELAASCQQLISDSTGEVTEELVERYYGGRVEATAFKVADAALAGRAAQALSMLRHALDTGVDPVPLVGALAMKVRAVARVANLRGSSASMAKELSMAPWQVDQARRDAQRFTSESLIEAVQALAEADAQVKGAGRDPVYAVERAVTVIALAASGR
ncbi:MULTISPECIES: DNA polymerase III subunit delta [unclassified Arthrobacter]|uniref:DNA polymerase III subunit delta n=1 Tax=unclassified Arthrobacter TaxID=235627 RepID=UPI00210498DA|nr:DNA polymerase III subunit delta [Arthrobacter sp. zg-Y1171]MCQ1986753.1 DNA polymerase III subunit delta [Arthrobacter sp. zg-Y844]MCQ1995418.1 DNA polymerase III subunit delta [Arthrobacter sp. zg-Y1171]UWX80547.1 DNA polymerase III subunit delta [Arthrobacter sp. zg-Y1171]